MAELLYRVLVVGRQGWVMQVDFSSRHDAMAHFLAERTEPDVIEVQLWNSKRDQLETSLRVQSDGKWEMHD